MYYKFKELNPNYPYDLKHISDSQSSETKRQIREDQIKKRGY